LPLFVTKFIAKYPEVSLVIQELLSHEIVDKMNNDLLDLGILVTPLNESSIVEIPLFYESFVVYMSTSHPLSDKNSLSFSDLDISEMWLLKEGHCFRSQAINICGDEQKTEETNHLRFESGSLETLRRIVERQFGYTLLPELATMDIDETRQKYIKTFSKPRPVREVSLVIHRKFMKRRLIDLLKEEILANIPESIRSNKKERVINWTE
ncbi:MAG: LysR substrate-binding domain-containing protein, partial [Bacteroidota bacterium]